MGSLPDSLAAVLVAGCVEFAFIAPAGAQVKLTSGAVALLVNQTTPENVATLQQAVTDADVDVRRVAARVAGVIERKDLAPLLLEQLARETDDAAAAEELRAVLFIQGVQALPEASAAGMRLGGRARLALSEWLARKDADRFASVLPGLAEGLSRADLSELAGITAMAIRQHPNARQRVTELWASLSTGAAWRSFLDTLGATALEDTVTLNAGLIARNPDVREETRWFALSHAAYGRTLPLAHVPSREGTTPAEDTEWARAGRELLARLVEKSKPADISKTIERLSSEHRVDAARLTVLKDILTPDERAALRSALGAESRSSVVSIGDRFSSLRGPVAARTFMSMTPGMLTSLFNVLGCTVGPRDDRFGGVRVTYLDDGRIEGVQVVPSQLSKECQPALGVLGVLTLAAPSQIVRQGEGQWLLLPMDAAAIACADQPRSASPDAPVRIGELHVTPPTKIRHVNPVYPESAERTGVQGVVVLQTEISETGCVRRSNVIRSVPGLDLAALRAVSSWTFTPTRVGSQAVPVFMTVTVNFSLR